jgi:hypothetical protein
MPCEVAGWKPRVVHHMDATKKGDVKDLQKTFAQKYALDDILGIILFYPRKRVPLKKGIEVFIHTFALDQKPIMKTVYA